MTTKVHIGLDVHKNSIVPAYAVVSGNSITREPAGVQPVEDMPKTAFGSMFAELKTEPLLLKKRGHYIEVTESNFRRISTISHVRASISGTIHRADGRLVRVEHFYFPLNDNGIGEFLKLVSSQPKTVKCFPTVTIRIDDATFNLIQTDEKNPIEDLKKFSVEATKAAKQLDSLLQLASEG